MSKIFFFIFLLILDQSCIESYPCKEFGKPDQKEIFFYARNGVGLNDVFSYEDYLLVTNYSNKSLTVSDFISIAKKYLDTATQKDTLIGSVIFIRQYPNHCTPLPSDEYMSNANRVDKLGIIEIGFQARNPDRSKKINDLWYVNLWHNGEAGNFVYLDDLLPKDSISKLKEVVDN